MLYFTLLIESTRAASLTPLFFSLTETGVVLRGATHRYSVALWPGVEVCVLLDHDMLLLLLK